MSYLRRAATLTSVALAAAGLATVTTQPASAATGGELRWAVSQYLNEHLTGQTSDGATVADGVVTFVDGVVDGDSVSYAGTARYAFAVGGTEYYSYSFSDVTVTYDDGAGTIAADVAWTAPTGPGVVEDALLTTFSTDDDWSDGSLTATPDWLGVVPADAYGAGKPVDGASWAADFVQALPSSLQGTFYASGSGNDPKKAPAAFTATDGTAAAPTVTAMPAYARNSVTIAVAGSGFDPAYDYPRLDGVYATLATADRFPETDDLSDRDKVPATDWVSDERIVDGSWAVVLSPPSRLLDPRKSYAIYTWQAHSHTNPDSDTTTPVTIDFSKVGKPTRLKAAKRGKQLVVTVGKAAAGRVAITFTKGKVTKKASAKVVSKTGQAKVKLPAATGTWKAAVTFKPWKANYRAATRTVSVKR